MEINVKKLEEMLVLQNKLNSIVNPDWRNAGNDWGMAILVEATEAIEHHGWKWWKKQTPDMPAVQMELVDIWHFMLSTIIEGSTDMTMEEISIHMSEYITNVSSENEYRAPNSEDTLLGCLKQLAIAGAQSIPLAIFLACIELANMAFDDLYEIYIAKNVLNIFRQANGYKTGEYIKDWSAISLNSPLIGDRSLEDNDHLMDILNLMPVQDADLYSYLYSELELRYSAVKGI